MDLKKVLEELDFGKRIQDYSEKGDKVKSQYYFSYVTPEDYYLTFTIKDIQEPTKVFEVVTRI